jgi:hypothetical protein
MWLGRHRQVRHVAVGWVSGVRHRSIDDTPYPPSLRRATRRGHVLRHEGGRGWSV